MIQRLMTAEEFAHTRIELPEAGQWAELIRGVPVHLQPPDLDHGTIVLNLSKALATYVHTSLNGYPCFDLGILVEQRPDTVLFPTCSYFLDGERFAEADKDYTQTVPALVVELLTTSDRRRQIQERISAYLKLGVSGVWLIDSSQQTVHLVGAPSGKSMRLERSDMLRGSPILDAFEMPVADLFKEPDWAR